jgi:NAD(P)-dependent dehydrogenase (short-subunit alcohol dehydrogenase family)
VEVAAGMNHPFILTVDLTADGAARKMVNDVVAHFGTIDILVNNAAQIIVAPSELITADDLLQAYATNLIAPVAATQEAIVHMKSNGGGHIINIGSPGYMMGIPYYAPYVCSKAALSAWTRTIQAEWSGDKIRVSEYFPGYIRTDSRPDSRLGQVDQDFLMAVNQNFLTKLFTKPKTPQDVARQVAGLIRQPKTLACSGLGVRIGTFISNIPGFRLNLARQLAKNARDKMNLSPFG